MPDTTHVEEYFTRFAAAFDSLYSETGTTSLVRFLNRRLRRDIYERFRLSLKHIQMHGLSTVLDVGCGPGRYELALGQLGVRRIVAIDVSPAMIQLAKSINDKSNGSDTQMEFIVADFMALSTTETFDAVLAMGFFDYVRDPLPVLQKMRALTSHSVIGSFPSTSWYRTPIRKVRYFFKRCPVYFYRRSDIDSLSKAAGFARNEILKIKGAGQDYFVTFFK